MTDKQKALVARLRVLAGLNSRVDSVAMREAAGLIDALEARVAVLEAALKAMVEHFATPTSERTAASYAKTNAQVAYEARAAIAAAKGA